MVDTENTKFEANATAMICGEYYEVRLINGPTEDGLYTVEVPFADGDFVEVLGVMKDNVCLMNFNAKEKFSKNN